MNTFPKFLLIATLLFPNIVVAKPCGNGYIRDDYECHRGGDGGGEGDATAFLWLLGIAAVGGVIYLVATHESAPSPPVYQAELDQYNAWTTQQAALLRDLIKTNCICDQDKNFTTTECDQAADYILTMEARAAWHKEMSLFMEGRSEKRPPRDPGQQYSLPWNYHRIITSEGSRKNLLFFRSRPRWDRHRQSQLTFPSR